MSKKLNPVPLKPGKIKPEEPKFKKVFSQVSRYSTVGLELGFSVAIGVLGGYYLDRWLNTSPWLTIFLLLCGVTAGFKRVYQALKELEKEQDEEDAGNR
ncbi:MAG: AtpZ/AtpI family protein [Desulfobulbaceae bacterium]|nr:AtpZ/AtpI family protein [Desulfobulbaceae bacterium]